MEIQEPKYEEIGLNKFKKLQEHENHYTSLGESNKHEEYMAMAPPKPVQEKKTKRRRISFLRVVVGVTMVMSCLAFSGVCVEAVFLIKSMFLASTPNITVDQLKELIDVLNVDQLCHLQSLGNTSNRDQLSSCQSLVDTLNVTSIRNQFNDLQSLVGSLNLTAIDQLSSLQPLAHDITALRAQLNGLESSVNTLNMTAVNRLNDLQSSVKSIDFSTTNRLNDFQFSLNTLNATAIDQLSSFQSLTHNITAIREELNSLNKLNTTTTDHLINLWFLRNISAFGDQLNSFQSLMNTLNFSTTDQLSQLWSSVNTLNTRSMNQLNDLQSSVNTLGMEQNATAIQVGSLQSSVNTLLVNAQPYQNCIEETRSCTNSQSRSGTRTWSHCTTPRLPVEKMGYYTIGMRCLYNPPPEKWDTSTLRQRGSEVECLCVAISGTSSQGAHAVDTFSLFTCTLTVTRCPLA